MVIAKWKAFARFLVDSRKICVVGMLTIAFAVFAISVGCQIKHVTVHVDGEIFTLYTLAGTVEDVLAQQGISLGEYDEVIPPLVNDTTKDLSITINRAFPITVMVGTEPMELHTVEKTVSELLTEHAISLGEFDVVAPSLDTIVSEGTSIQITQITKSDLVVEEAVPFGKKSVPNNQLERGTSKVITEGVAGKKELVYEVTTTNGEETDRVLVGEKIITAPVDQVIEYGTKEFQVVNRGSSNRTVNVSGLNYSRELVCKATAYILRGRTATGMTTQHGVVAVDPRVIPLGSKLYIQSLDGKQDYGYAIAADTGGAIKGNIVDLWVPSYADACKIGVSKVKVYILNE